MGKMLSFRTYFSLGFFVVFFIGFFQGLLPELFRSDVQSIYPVLSWLVHNGLILGFSFYLRSPERGRFWSPKIIVSLVLLLYAVVNLVAPVGKAYFFNWTFESLTTWTFSFLAAYLIGWWWLRDNTALYLSLFGVAAATTLYEIPYFFHADLVYLFYRREIWANPLFFSSKIVALFFLFLGFYGLKPKRKNLMYLSLLCVGYALYNLWLFWILPSGFGIKMTRWSWRVPSGLWIIMLITSVVFGREKER